MRLSNLLAAGALALGGLCLAAPAQAQVPAAQHLGGGFQTHFSKATGYQFQPTTDLLVTALGVWDENQDGLTADHDVGIFRVSDGSLVGSAANVPAGTLGLLVGDSRYVPVTPFLLTAGEQYYIVADNFADGQDRYAFGSGAVGYAPELVWQGFVDTASNDIFDVPFNHGGDPGNFGPNFLFIPEPATVGLLGLAGLAGLQRRRR